MSNQIETGRVSPEFPYKVLIGLQDIIIDSNQNSTSLRCFLDAYHYRSRFNWLKESGKIPGTPDGLEAALKHALRLYIPPRLLGIDAPSPRVENAYMQIDAQEVNFQDLTRLRRAAQAVMEDYWTMEQFARSLHRAEYDPKMLPQNDIKHHLLQALDYYVRHHQSGTSSSDPW